MLLLPIPRRHLLTLLPKGGTVAEIGVAEGDFSQTILETAAPEVLHLIDPWVHQDREDYRTDLNNVADGEQDRRFRGVVERFAGAVETGRVIVRRAFSADAVASFGDGRLDWVYVDGLHTEEGVLADLRAYAPKVKQDGFILGHDYTNRIDARRMGFGVVEAVNRFVAETGFRFLALTVEPWPTYVLVRDAEAPAAQAFLAKAVATVPFPVEIRDFPQRGGASYQHRLFAVDGKHFGVQSF